MALVLAVVACGLVLSTGWWRMVQPADRLSPLPTTTELAAIDWGTAEQPPAAVAMSALRVGAYATNISDINLLQDQFSVNC